MTPQELGAGLILLGFVGLLTVLVLWLTYPGR